MAKGATIRLFHATAAGNLPPAGSLVEGELALDALSNPARLWTQVPTSRDPSGRIDLLKEGGVSLPVSIANGGTNATTGPLALDSLSGSSGATAGYLSRNAAGAWTLSTPSSGVTSLATGTGLTGGSPTAITNTGTIALDTPVSIANGGTNTTSLPQGLLFSSGGTTVTSVANWWAWVPSGFPHVLGGEVNTNSQFEAPTLALTRRRGTPATPAAVQTGDTLANLAVYGYPDSVVATLIQPVARIQTNAAENHTAANHGTFMEFLVTPLTENGMTSILRLASAPKANPNPVLARSASTAVDPHQLSFGPAGLNIDRASNANNYVWLQASFLDVGGTAGRIVLNAATGDASKPGTLAWIASSDARAKRDVNDYKTGLDALCALRPHSFCYNGKCGTKDTGTVYYGVTAQEARGPMPEIVVKMSNHTLGVDGGPVVWALVNAVRELRERLIELENKNGRSW